VPSQAEIQQQITTRMLEGLKTGYIRWTSSYALGELIAEVGACYAAAQLGIPCSDNLSNHTSYLASWLKELENDPKAILKAASQASKATAFVLGFSRNAEPQPNDLQAV
jgi:antirestriction protein ArdC